MGFRGLPLPLAFIMTIVLAPLVAQSSLLADLEMDESFVARLIKMQCIHKTVPVDGVEGAKPAGSREQAK